MAKIAPSILSADFANLERDIRDIRSNGGDWAHVDVMDGLFVPNISIGIPVVQAIRPVTDLPLDVHLMIVQPERYVEEFRKTGADILTVHLEACTHLHRTIQQIKAAGMKAGVSLNPHSPVGLLEDVIRDIDVVLLMSVNPGFGGQSFIEQTIEKVKKLKTLIQSAGAKTLIEIDGGVNFETGRRLVEAGADALVAGSFVFNSPDPKSRIEGYVFGKVTVNRHERDVPSRFA